MLIHDRLNIDADFPLDSGRCSLIQESNARSLPLMIHDSRHPRRNRETFRLGVVLMFVGS